MSPNVASRPLARRSGDRELHVRREVGEHLILDAVEREHLEARVRRSRCREGSPLRSRAAHAGYTSVADGLILSGSHGRCVPTSLAGADAAPSIKLVAERAYVELRDRIVTLRLAPGTVLREDELMREMTIGRTPLREAVKRLALENLLAVQPRRGTFVSAVESADIVNITEVRAELEGYAAELAAQRIDGEPPRAPRRRCCTRSRSSSEAGDQDWLMRFDERIHRFTWEAPATRTWPRRWSATSPIRCASGTWCSTACPDSVTPCTTSPTCSRRCSRATLPSLA